MIKSWRLTASSLSQLRWAIEIKKLPRPIVVWRVFDSLTRAEEALTPMAEWRRKTAIARFYQPGHDRAMFVLIFKAPHV